MEPHCNQRSSAAGIWRVVFAAGLTGLLALATPSYAAEQEPQAAFQVRQSEIADYKAVFATVETVDIMQARARIGGTVVSLSVDEGDFVKTDQQLAWIGDPKKALQLSAIDAQIRSLEAQEELAATVYGRVESLYQSGNVSKARLDTAKTELDVVKAQIQTQIAQRAVVAEEQAEGVVRAPASGRVLNVAVTEGAVVLPGESIAEIAAETYILRLYLPERHARFIKINEHVRVGSRGLGRLGPENKTGTVRQVYPELDRGRVVADVTVDGLGDFFVGERVRVWVSTGFRKVIVIPADYLFRRYGIAYVRLENGTDVVIQEGRPADSGIEVLSGLAPGDVIIRP